MIWKVIKKIIYLSIYGMVLAAEYICEKTGRVIIMKGRPETPDTEKIYLVRYYILPRYGNGWQLYIHRFLRSDHDLPHDHPFDFIGLVLKGGYREMIMTPLNRKTGKLDYKKFEKFNPPGSFLLRAANHLHKVLISGTYSWAERKKAPLTVILRSPRHQEWGFWAPEGKWIDQKDYLQGLEKRAAELNTNADKWESGALGESEEHAIPVKKTSIRLPKVGEDV